MKQQTHGFCICVTEHHMMVRKRKTIDKLNSAKIQPNYYELYNACIFNDVEILTKPITYLLDLCSHLLIVRCYTNLI